MKKYDKNFGGIFVEAMKFNLEMINKQKNKSGAAALIADYIQEYILKPKNILENMQLTTNFAYFYEKR